MSSLIFYTDQNQALIATDTLAVHPDGAPLMFSSKALYLSHLRTIIVGTGVGTFSTEWATEVNNHLVVRGVEHLNFHTPRALRKRWKQFRKSFPEIESLTTTVYHFGISEEDHEVTGFAYRSTNNFESERLSYGLKIKPECEFEMREDFHSMIPVIMKAQRKYQESLDPSERLHIGGEAMVMQLTRDFCTTVRVYKFEDFEDQLSTIFRNFQSRDG